MFNFIFKALKNKAIKTPYYHLDGYMERYWLVPYFDPAEHYTCGPVRFFNRPLAWCLQKFGIAVRVHHILSSDHGRDYHDHPWKFITILLKGSYIESRPLFKFGFPVSEIKKIHKAGSIIFRRAESWHRLEINGENTVWTLFITLKQTQKWGFLNEDGSKIYHDKYKI